VCFVFDDSFKKLLTLRIHDLYKDCIKVVKFGDFIFNMRLQIIYVLDLNFDLQGKFITFFQFENSDFCDWSSGLPKVAEDEIYSGNCLTFLMSSSYSSYDFTISFLTLLHVHPQIH
jgi:hypothetical protein